MYGIIVDLLQPFGWLMWGTAMSVAWVWWRKPELQRPLRWPAILFLGLFLDSLPATAWLTSAFFETRFERVTRRPDNVQAIVVLGANAIPPRPPETVTRPGHGSLLRALRAAELYRDGPPCPVIISGGKPEPSAPGDSPGRTMAEVLRRAGVADRDITIDEDSRDTAQNAAFTAKLLRERGLATNVLLVTSASHLWRSERLFVKQQIDVIPAGCDYQLDHIDPGPFLFWPRASAIQANQGNFHEALGFVVYWLRGEF